MKEGYIKLYRKIQENELWKERRVFSKAEAWIDILMEVQHTTEPTKVILGMTVLTCTRGESLKSLETWGERWGWHKSKVRRFLKLLVDNSMIELKNDTVTTRLKVCQYDEYQGERNANETQMKRKRNADETQMKTDNNVKNEKNENKEKYTPEFFTSKEFHKMIFDSFPKYRLEPKDVFAYYPKIKDYEASKGKKYKDYVATTRNWVRADIEKGKYRTFIDDDEKERFMRQFNLLSN